MDEIERDLIAMAGGNSTAIEKANPNGVTPKDPDKEIGVEMGVEVGWPFTSFQQFTNGHGKNTGGYLVPSNELVPIENLVEMRRKDGTARALMRLMTLPIRAAMKDAKWVAPDEETGADAEVEFANQMFNTPPANGGMESPMSSVIRNVLLAMSDGFSVFEEVRWIPDKGPMKGKVTLQKLAHRDSRTLQAVIDEDGSYNGWRQLTMLNGRTIDVHIPKEKSWYYAVSEEENLYYGVSMFESAWHHFDAKRKLYYIAHIAAQMAAVPGRIGEAGPAWTREDVRQFKKALADFAFNPALVVPPGGKLTPFNANSGFDFLKLIEHHDTQMAKSLLAKFLSEEAHQVLIQSGDADPAADFFVMQLQAVMEEVSQRFSHYLMPKFIDWNFGSGKYPEYEFGALTNEDKAIIKEMMVAIGTAQSSMWNEEFILELEKKSAAELGLDIDYDAVETRKEEEKTKEAEFQQQYFDQQQQVIDQPAPAPGGKPTATGKPPPPPPGAP